MSDDDLSDDNLDMTELYKEVYLRGHVMDKELSEIQKAEVLCKQEIEKQIEETRI